MPKEQRAEVLSRPVHPHDALVKWAFKQVPHAQGLLRAVLSPEEMAALDLATLRVEDGDHVDAELSHLYSDLALSAEMYGERVYFYALVEQQRKQEELMVLRVGQYTMRMWGRMVREPSSKQSRSEPTAQPASRGTPRRLPPILPIVLYNGRTPWTAPTAFQDLILVPEAARGTLLPHIPHFCIRLVDLSGGRMDGVLDSALTALGRVVLWSLSVAGDDERLEKEFGRIGAALDEVLRSPDAAAALQALLRYLGATHPEMPASKLREIIENVTGEHAREVVVTFLDQIEQQGRKEGRVEGQAAILLGLLAKRFGPVPAAMKKRIVSAGERELQTWALRVLDAASLEDVLGVERDPATPATRAAARRATSGRRSRT